MSLMDTTSDLLRQDREKALRSEEARAQEWREQLQEWREDIALHRQWRETMLELMGDFVSIMREIDRSLNRISMK